MRHKHSSCMIRGIPDCIWSVWWLWVFGVLPQQVFLKERCSVTEFRLAVRSDASTMYLQAAADQTHWSSFLHPALQKAWPRLWESLRKCLVGLVIFGITSPLETWIWHLIQWKEGLLLFRLVIWLIWTTAVLHAHCCFSEHMLSDLCVSEPLSLHGKAPVKRREFHPPSLFFPPFIWFLLVIMQQFRQHKQD